VSLIPRMPERSPGGPFDAKIWRSPLRGPWLASFLGSALLPLITICAITGFLSQAAYNPGLGDNSVLPGGGLFNPYFFDWPTSPSWLYGLNQGLHVGSGLAAIPILLAKLWSAMPKLFEWPPIRSIAHVLERASLALLVGGSIFVFFTGVFNIQVFYPWPFDFVPAHYYGALVFLGALVLHIAVKIPVARRAFREKGIIRPLRDDLAHTEPERHEEDTTAPLSPARATVSRRGFIGAVGLASLGLGVMAAGQSIGGPFRRLALLAPRGRNPSSGPNGFQINRTAAVAGIQSRDVGSTWRLKLQGGRKLELSREMLMAMPLETQELPIACVEGWSTTQTWTGVPLRDLAALAQAPDGAQVLVESLQKGGTFNHATLAANQISDERSLLALQVNGVDLSLDHGFPARVIVPALPGVHNTKWVASMTFEEPE